MILSGWLRQSYNLTKLYDFSGQRTFASSFEKLGAASKHLLITRSKEILLRQELLAVAAGVVAAGAVIPVAGTHPSLHRRHRHRRRHAPHFFQSPRLQRRHPS